MSANANVNRPVVKEQKEADVNRKLQIYGIISAFQQGKVPSNDQIDVALNSFLATKALSHPSDKLSDEGKGLVQDTRNVVEEAKKLLLSKNDGNLLQDFIWQTASYDYKNVQGPGVPVAKDQAQRDGDEALKGLRTLGQLLITNGQFRKLLKDSTVLLRDIAGDAATNAADKVRPDEETLNSIDRPAEDNTWHEAPDLSKDGLKKQAKDVTSTVYGGNPKQDAKDVASHVNQNTGHASAEADKQAGLAAAREAAEHKGKQNIDDETKEKIKARNEEYRRKAKNYFNQKVPKERKDQTVFRLKKMILECQQHPEYSDAIQTLLRLAENYGRHGRVVGQGAADTTKQTRTGFAQAEYDLRTLIERFANGTSTEDLWASIQQIYKDAEKDPELRGWFKNLDAYIRRCLLEQGYILEEDSSHQWDRLYEQGKYLLRDKYRTHTDRVVDEVKFVADQFDKDPQNKAFATAVEKLFKDLGNDHEGKPVFKPHLVKDLTEIIIPAVLENIAYVPIPRIEYSDSQFDAVIENLVLESDNFAPNIMEVASEHYFRWGRKKVANKNKNTMDIKVAGIQMDLRDVSFHIKRKQGFPSITDTGVVDLLLPGEGFSFRMKVSTSDKKDRQHFFKVEKVDVDFKDLKFKVTKSSHKLLFSLFKPFALKAMRPALQKAVEKAIKDQFNQLDNFLYQVKQEADKALAEAKSSPERVPNIYQRYTDAFQKLITQGKEKAAAVADDKKVNLAVTQEDSIFPNISLPGGISSKATEYKQLAKKGEKWESPVFSIGSAKKSDNIPRAPKVERKPHTTAQPGLTGGSSLGGAGAGLAGTGAGLTGTGAGLTGTGSGLAGPGVVIGGPGAIGGPGSAIGTGAGVGAGGTEALYGGATNGALNVDGKAPPISTNGGLAGNQAVGRY